MKFGVGVTFTCGYETFYIYILHKFVLHVARDQFSDKFNNGQKTIKMADLLRFFAFYVYNFTL